MMNNRRRRLTLLMLGGTTLLTAGCITRPTHAARPPGTACYRTGKFDRPKLTCTPGPIPSEEAETAAKRFAPAPGLLTVYVVRQRWGDGEHVVRIGSSGGTAVDTIPESFARLRLAPGSHRLTATWPQGTSSLDISGAAGEVIFVEVIGTIWAWEKTAFRLERGEPARSRERAAKSRLVADFVIR